MACGPGMQESLGLNGFSSYVRHRNLGKPRGKDVPTLFIRPPHPAASAWFVLKEWQVSSSYIVVMESIKF